MDTPNPAPARYAGLDGLRAVAVGSVVVYHLFPASLMRGGFVGVDVFFVISGFLITSLLLRPSARSGTAAGLVEFWRRRARRLLPALAALVTICSTAAWLIGGDVLARLGSQVFGAATFGYNWVSLSEGSDYFRGGTPELFRNLWSLAVEEQFYVVWPVLLPLVLLIPTAWARATLVLLAAGGSAGWMASLAASGGDPTRAYFGTDTHAFGILIGIALAFLCSRMPRREWMSRDATLRIVTAVGCVALVGIGIIASLPPTDSTATFPSALLAASGLTAVAIFTAVWPESWFGRGLDAHPVRWFGERSYGIYLWHWPLLVLLVAVLTGAGPEAGVPVGVGALALALTLVVSAVSYRFLEQPIRRDGFRGTVGKLALRLSGTPATRFTALALVTTGAVVLGGTTAALAAAPRQTSAEMVILAGEAALEAQVAVPTGSPTAPAAQAEPAEPAAATAPLPNPVGPAAPTPSPTPIAGTEITAIGDSVMLAAAPALVEHFPGIAVDAAVSRSMWAGPGIIGSMASAGQLRRYVVVALGTNGPVSGESLGEIARLVGPERHLVLVNSFAPREWIPGVNADLAAFASSLPGVAVADWSAAIGGQVELLAGDSIHPEAPGGAVFAQTVDLTLRDIEAERAQREYEERMRAYLIDNELLPRMPR